MSVLHERCFCDEQDQIIHTLFFSVLSSLFRIMRSMLNSKNRKKNEKKYRVTGSTDCQTHYLIYDREISSRRERKKKIEIETFELTAEKETKGDKKETHKVSYLLVAQQCTYGSIYCTASCHPCSLLSSLSLPFRYRC